MTAFQSKHFIQPAAVCCGALLSWLGYTLPCAVMALAPEYSRMASGHHFLCFNVSDLHSTYSTWFISRFWCVCKFKRHPRPPFYKTYKVCFKLVRINDAVTGHQYQIPLPAGYTIAAANQKVLLRDNGRSTSSDRLDNLQQVVENERIYANSAGVSVTTRAMHRWAMASPIQIRKAHAFTFELLLLSMWRLLVQLTVLRFSHP